MSSAMRQDQFERVHHDEWKAFARWLEARAQFRSGPRTKANLAEDLPDDIEFPKRYRRICQQLALAKRRGFSRRLIDQLDGLAQQGHTVMYRVPPPKWRKIVDFFSRDYPRLVRSEVKYVWVSAFLFFGPLIALIVLLQYRPELVHSIIGPESLMGAENNFDPSASHTKLGRESGDDLQMFGFYIWNNISIGFQTFASGLLFTLGSIFYLVFNGINIGAVAGHLTAIGYGDPFWRFVAGHSGPELMAIVLSGAAGLRLGMSLIAPGNKTRWAALLEAGEISARMILGVVALLTLAAFIEAFWSSIMWVPRLVKFTVGITIWSLILLWFWRGGRGSNDAA